MRTLFRLLFLWFFSLLVILVFAYLAGSYLGYTHLKSHPHLLGTQTKHQKNKIDAIDNDTASILNALKKLQPSQKKQTSDKPTLAKQTTKSDIAASPKKEPIKLKKPTSKKPLLAIIIDDVRSFKQLRHIKAIGLPLTASIFPPDTIMPNTPLLAKSYSYTMVHLPLQTSNTKYNKKGWTLYTDMNEEQIHAAVKRIRQLFPHTIFINNHTGSLFSKNKTAMTTLLKELKAHGFIYIDSVTVNSKATRDATKELGLPYIRNNIFLDHRPSIAETKRQLKRVVRLAKKRGYAIAIGHPHYSTLKAIKRNKHLLEDVEIVDISTLLKEIL